jgi:mannose-6-phosphate isomerase
MLYALKFHPLCKERVWGGRSLARLYNKPLPPEIPVGESWEISDRPGDVSLIANGPLAGKDLRWLMETHTAELFGEAAPPPARFPLLVKILDAREMLSLQVHPPAAVAARLGGEPKTELWYVAAAAPGAEIFAGLRRGVTRAAFEQAMARGNLAECIHRIPVSTGDALLLPSGRVHALGGGLVIFEVQQNSDTTYRVFDWNRMGLDGKPRQLHIRESLASINFDDFEPGLIRRDARAEGEVVATPLVADPLFTADILKTERGGTTPLPGGRALVLGTARGQAFVAGGPQEVELHAGEFCLLPASVTPAALRLAPGTALLRVRVGGTPAR